MARLQHVLTRVRDALPRRCTKIIYNARGRFFLASRPRGAGGYARFIAGRAIFALNRTRF